MNNSCHGQGISSEARRFVKKILVWLRVFYWELRVEGGNRLYLMMEEKSVCAVQAAKAPLAARGKCDKIKMSGYEIIFQ